MLAVLSVAFTLTALLSANPSNVDLGKRLFNDPGLGQSGASCATCHAPDAEESDGLIRAGHPLHDAAQRPFWRGDARRSLYRRLDDAIEPCLDVFMLAEDTLPDSTRRVLATYIKSLAAKSRRKVAALTITTGLEAGADYNRPYYEDGNADVGKDLFYRSCHGCHPHGGAGLGPSVIGRSVAETVRALREGNGLLRGARKDNTWMPAFGTDRLSNEQAADLAAFVATLK